MVDFLTQDLFDEIVEVRKLLNKNAETSYKEFKTNKILCRVLENHNIEYQIVYTTGIVVNLIKDNKPCIAVRCDMDALPFGDGAKHLCGHDYHMAVCLGTLLSLKENNFSHNVKFIFQPAEEGNGGALKLIEENVLENPKVEKIIGYHVWPNLPSGSIEYTEGSPMASVDDFKIIFKGSGGHAAMPDKFKNPLMPAIEFINKINKFKDELQEEFVLTFSGIAGGETQNVVPDTATVFGTFRTFSDPLRDKIYNKFKETLLEVEKEFNIDSDLVFSYPFPALTPCKDSMNEFISGAKNFLGEDNVKLGIPTYTGEDFAFYCKEIPGIHFRLGIAQNGLGCASLHNINFNADDSCIKTGVKVISDYIINYYK